MITLDRSNSKNIYAYKYLDNIEVKVEQKESKGDFNLYLLRDKLFDRVFIFGGEKGSRAFDYIGFETSINEVLLFDNLYDLYIEHYKENFCQFIHYSATSLSAAAFLITLYGDVSELFSYLKRYVRSPASPIPYSYFFTLSERSVFSTFSGSSPISGTSFSPLRFV